MPMQLKIMTVVGARPNFMKAAPIITAIKEHNQRSAESASQADPTNVSIRHTLVHTGQHYDELMSDRFFADLNLPKPDVHLGVGSGSHAAQTAEIMKRFEEVFVREWPDILIVVGDVNSTLACALAAAKLPVNDPVRKPLVAHVEAGLRSFDRSMPEEHNRVLTDHLSDILFVTERSGLENLRHEGIPAKRIHFVGNTMIDTLLAFREKADASTVLSRLGLKNGLGKNGTEPTVAPYALLTLHRPSNVDDRRNFLSILEGLQELGDRYPIIFPVHPRTRTRIKEFGLEHYFAESAMEHTAETAARENAMKGIVLVEPLGYLDFLCLMKHARLALTDSGGIQEETTCLGVPCVTLRENTERPVTVQCGTNIIAGVTRQGIRDAIHQKLATKAQKLTPENWDGAAGPRIVDTLLQQFRNKQVFPAKDQATCAPASSEQNSAAANK